MVAVHTYFRRKGTKVEAHRRSHSPSKDRLDFKDVQSSIARNLEGAKVPPRFQSQYGKTYSREEALEASKKITGTMWRNKDGN